jgi:phospholipase D1/2
MAYNRRDDDLAYGEYHGRPQPEGEEGERGFIGDMGKRFFGGRNNVSSLPGSTIPFVTLRLSF